MPRRRIGGLSRAGNRVVRAVKSLANRTVLFVPAENKPIVDEAIARATVAKGATGWPL
jgi:hypothetical protein